MSHPRTDFKCRLTPECPHCWLAHAGTVEGPILCKHQHALQRAHATTLHALPAPVHQPYPSIPGYFFVFVYRRML